MISMLFAALASAINAPPPPPVEDLAQCLAHLSNAPEFRDIGSDNLAENEAFLEAAIDNYCSHEASPFWTTAHARSRQELGLSAEGSPSVGQQRVAERQMRIIVREAWPLASTYRAHPRPLSEKKMTDTAFAYLLSDQTERVMRIVEGPLTCVGKGARAGKARVGRNGVTPSKALAASCGYQSALDDLAGLLQARFPDAKPDFASRTAQAFLQEMGVWASTSQ
jgi:hypothetical protein